MEHRLLDILACPICKGPLVHHREQQVLVCRADRRGRVRAQGHGGPQCRARPGGSPDDPRPVAHDHRLGAAIAGDHDVFALVGALQQGG